MSQSHFTIRFPLRADADSKALASRLSPMMPTLGQAADEIGTIHYARFTVLDAKTLLFLGDFDGAFAELIAQLGEHAGVLFDAIFDSVDDPPPLPVASHLDGFVEWMADHLIRPLMVYSAYPDVTAKETKRLAAAADVTGATELNVFLVVLPMKSKLAFTEVDLVVRARTRATQRDLDTVGTPHFAQFVPLNDNQIGFFTVYDGSFDTYIADFTKNIGHIFDMIFKFTKNPPPSPCAKHLQAFIDFAASANREPIGLYQAYPGLSVQDVHALVADSKAS